LIEEGKMRASKLFKKKLNNNHIINDLRIDSRLIEPNDVFFAIKGEIADGSLFIPSAIDNGAKSIVLENEWIYAINYPDINFIIVEDVRKMLAICAKSFYQNLSSNMTLIGITGTNGKTTVSTLLYKYFQFLHKKASMIGSNGIYIMNNFYSTKNTTPDILEIYSILRESKKMGISTIIMEVSSHAVKMMRVFGLEFKIVLITNLTQDHLDFHKTIEDYKYTKGLFLSNVDEKNTILINKDIDDFKFFYLLTKGNTFTYGFNNSNYKFSNYKISLDGSEFDIIIDGKIEHIKTSLLGIFNIYNVISFISIIHQLGMYTSKTAEFLNTKINILGRMEVIKKQNKYAVIDFAHSPDGVENVLNFLNEVKANKLYVVIGCGGDRDQGKRKIIGDIVTRLADFVIFTNDNPRSEEPSKIIDDILDGAKKNNYLVILDRRMAIEECFKMTLNNDIIAILGKGNEQYQIINNDKIPFSDKKIVQEIFQ